MSAHISLQSLKNQIPQEHKLLDSIYHNILHNSKIELPYKLNTYKSQFCTVFIPSDNVKFVSSCASS